PGSVGGPYPTREVQRGHLAAGGQNQRRAGIPAESRTIVSDSAHLVTEAADGSTLPELAGLESLDVEPAAEDLHLCRHVVPRVLRGIADHRDVFAPQVLGRSIAER